MDLEAFLMKYFNEHPGLHPYSEIHSFLTRYEASKDISYDEVMRALRSLQSGSFIITAGRTGKVPFETYGSTNERYRSYLSFRNRFVHPVQDYESKKTLSQNGKKSLRKSSINRLLKKNFGPLGRLTRSGGQHRPSIGVQAIAGVATRILLDMRGRSGAIFGVFGKWGRGKTYFINEILKRDEVSSAFHVVHFHAWKYQDTPAAWAYLYETLANSYLNERKIVRLGRTIKIALQREGYFKSGWDLLVFAAPLVFAFTPFSYKYQAIILIYACGLLTIFGKLLYIMFTQKRAATAFLKKYTDHKSFSKHLGLQHEVQEEIRILLAAWLNKKKRVLLVIDDLDRCPEDNIIKVIESLRVMLDDQEISPKIVAVLAVDERILKRAIQHKYKNILPTNAPTQGNDEPLDETTLTREYMDKLFLTGLRLANLEDQEKAAIVNAFIDNDERRDGVSHGSFPIQTTMRDEVSLSEVRYAEDEIPMDSLSAIEKTAIQTAVISIPKITPRQIDIFIFRYLLARNLCWEIFEIEYNPTTLCNLLSRYTDNYEKFQRDVIQRRSGRRGELDKVLEMVITY